MMSQFNSNSYCIGRHAVYRGAPTKAGSQAGIEKCTSAINSTHLQTPVSYQNEETPKTGTQDVQSNTNKEKRSKWTREEYKQAVAVGRGARAKGAVAPGGTFLAGGTFRLERHLGFHVYKLQL